MLTLLLALATPSAALDNITPRHINTSGVRAVYTRSVEPDGTIHLRGMYKNDGSRFHFKVQDGRVYGTIDKGKYEFKAPR